MDAAADLALEPEDSVAEPEGPAGESDAGVARRVPGAAPGGAVRRHRFSRRRGSRTARPAPHRDPAPPLPPSAAGLGGQAHRRGAGGRPGPGRGVDAGPGDGPDLPGRVRRPGGRGPRRGLGAAGARRPRGAPRRGRPARRRRRTGQRLGGAAGALPGAGHGRRGAPGQPAVPGGVPVLGGPGRRSPPGRPGGRLAVVRGAQRGHRPGAHGAARRPWRRSNPSWGIPITGFGSRPCAASSSCGEARRWGRWSPPSPTPSRGCATPRSRCCTPLPAGRWSARWWNCWRPVRRPRPRRRRLVELIAERSDPAVPAALSRLAGRRTLMGPGRVVRDAARQALEGVRR